MSHPKVCPTCGRTFNPRSVRAVYCQSKCSKNTARRSDRKRHHLRFIGVDGEGVDRPDSAHEYVMLSVGARTLWNAGHVLTLESILSFLWECYTTDPDAVYVGFFLGYDFTSWLRQLPEQQAYLLFTGAGIKSRTSQRKTKANPFPDPVVWEGWEIDIMAGRRFKLRPHVHQSSAFNALCRNRTCRVSLEDTFRIAGEPTVLVSGEMEWTVPGGSDPGDVREFRGWSAYTTRPVETPSRSWMYICDTGSFWQTSFLNVINPKNWGDHPVCTEHEYKTVLQGKADRGKMVGYGETNYFEEMRSYNVLENRILSRVTERLNEGFMNDDIPIRIKRNEWYGPGRAAQAWMHMLHANAQRVNRISFDSSSTEVRSNIRVAFDSPSTEARPSVAEDTRYVSETSPGGILSEDVYSSVPSWFVDSARSSYYGGWFELFAHGHCGDLWEYDINSAYPFVIASLPCLHTSDGHDGRYTRGDSDSFSRDADRSDYVLLHATIRGSDPYIGVMPFRTRTGHILRPHVVKGWYWLHEVDAARDAGLVDTVEVHEWMSYTPCGCTPPFNPPDIGIERLYNLRLQVGKSTPAGKAFKLVYNSAYGKTAQSVGAPKFANPIYASLITAGCRTLILKAIATHPRGSSAVSMVATDGIYFLERHPVLPLSESKLGYWSETFRPGMTQLMPGVYWDDETRRRVGAGSTPKLKSRGVPARDLAKQINRLDKLFAQSHFALANGMPYEWPTITFTQQFTMLSAKAALAQGKWNEAGRVEHGSTRSISANPISKRQPNPYRDSDWDGIVRTPPYPTGPTLDTYPYEKLFGYLPDEPEHDRDGRDPLAYWRDLFTADI